MKLGDRLECPPDQHVRFSAETVRVALRFVGDPPQADFRQNSGTVPRAISELGLAAAQANRARFFVLKKRLHGSSLWLPLGEESMVYRNGSMRGLSTKKRL